MLFIIELLFLAAGLWALIAGRLPIGLLRLLFGKGEYTLPPSRARWFGALLASPLPIAASATFVLALLLGEGSTRPAILFEYLYLITVIIASIIVARRIRRPPETVAPRASVVPTGAAREPRGYGARLLVIFALGVLSCMALGGIGTLYMAIAATFAGDAPPNFLPIALPVVVLVAAVAGAIQLIRLLRR
jgi:hypothetical protein